MNSTKTHVTFRRLLFAGLAGAVISVACAGTQIGSPKDYEVVALNRVYPYPTPEELARQKTEVYLASHFTTELPSKVVGPSMTVVQQDLLGILGEAGARVIDRSLDPLKSVRADLTKQYKERGRRDEADSALITRISRYEHGATYEPPSSLFKSEEELAADPGTCTHVAHIEVDINHVVIPTDEVPRATLTLRNSAEFSESQHDEECPITDERREALLEEALAEVLPCISTPVKNEFAPRGYIEAHRTSATGDLHIFKTSLGSKNGARPGIELSIFREQHMTTADGQQDRKVIRIGAAVISDQIGEEFSWVLIDPDNIDEEVLAGHMVRAVYNDSFKASDLGFGGCSSMLETRIAPR